VWPIALLGLGALLLLSAGAAPPAPPVITPVPAWVFVTHTGLPNQTGNAAVLANLRNLVPVIIIALGLARSVDRRFRLTSAFRTIAVNRAAGGKRHSRHLRGLAFDLALPAHRDGGPTRRQGAALLQSVAQLLRANAYRMPNLRAVLVESGERPHLHVSLYRPGDVLARSIA